jgi:hypothetical protein
MGADIIAMGMGMRSMSWREALFLLRVVRRVRSGMIGRMMFPVFDVTRPVLSVGFTGMVGRVAGPCIALLFWWHMHYFAFFFIKKMGRMQENRKKNQDSGTWYSRNVSAISLSLLSTR